MGKNPKSGADNEISNYYLVNNKKKRSKNANDLHLLQYSLLLLPWRIHKTREAIIQLE